MKAIVVKYSPATDKRGSRFVATAEGVERVSHPYDYALDADDNARRAAEKLAAKMGGMDLDAMILAAGALPNGDWVFCFVTSHTIREIPEQEG